MHKLNPKVSNAVHGNHGYPTPRGQRPEEGPGNDGLGRDPPGDTTSRLRRWIDNTRKLRERMTLFRSTPTSREGRERQAKRGWHPTIPFGQTAKIIKNDFACPGRPLTVIYCHINIGLPRGRRENTYHVSTVALEGNQEYSWPEPCVV